MGSSFGRVPQRLRLDPVGRSEAIGIPVSESESMSSTIVFSTPSKVRHSLTFLYAVFPALKFLFLSTVRNLDRQRRALVKAPKGPTDKSEEPHLSWIGAQVCASRTNPGQLSDTRTTTNGSGSADAIRQTAGGAAAECSVAGDRRGNPARRSDRAVRYGNWSRCGNYSLGSHRNSPNAGTSSRSTRGCVTLRADSSLRVSERQADDLLRDADRFAREVRGLLRRDRTGGVGQRDNRRRQAAP